MFQLAPTRQSNPQGTYLHRHDIILRASRAKETREGGCEGKSTDLCTVEGELGIVEFPRYLVFTCLKCLAKPAGSFFNSRGGRYVAWAWFVGWTCSAWPRYKYAVADDLGDSRDYFPAIDPY